MNYEIKNSFIKAKIKLFGAELNSLQKIDARFGIYLARKSKILGKTLACTFSNSWKIKNMIWFYKNKKYNLSQHGFARDREFELIKKEDDFIEFSLKNDEETLKNYPFLFELNISYKLRENKINNFI